MVSITLTPSWSITSDPHCFILERTQKGRTRQVGFYSSFRGLVKAVAETVMRESSAKNLPALHAELTAILEALNKGAEEIVALQGGK